MYEKYFVKGSFGCAMIWLFEIFGFGSVSVDPYWIRPKPATHLANGHAFPLHSVRWGSESLPRW
ncbi:unnamed protein product [Musa hybrid cultivar]